MGRSHLGYLDALLAASPLPFLEKAKRLDAISSGDHKSRMYEKAVD
jgi:hypothetical protein